MFIAVRNLRADNCNAIPNSMVHGTMSMTGLCGWSHAVYRAMREAMGSPLFSDSSESVLYVEHFLAVGPGHARFVPFMPWERPKKDSTAASTIDRRTMSVGCSLYIHLPIRRLSSREAVAAHVESGALTDTLMRGRLCGGAIFPTESFTVEYLDMEYVELLDYLYVNEPRSAVIYQDAAADLEEELARDPGEGSFDALARMVSRPKAFKRDVWEWFDGLAAEKRTEVWQRYCNAGKAAPEPPVDWEGLEQAELPAEHVLAVWRGFVGWAYRNHQTRTEIRKAAERLPKYVPLAVGFRALGPATERRHPRGAFPHVYVEPLVGLGRVRPVWSLRSDQIGNNGLFWTFHHDQEHGLFLAKGRDFN